MVAPDAMMPALMKLSIIVVMPKAISPKGAGSAINDAAAGGPAGSTPAGAWAGGVEAG